MRRKLGVVLIGTLAVTIVAAGCQKNTGTPGGNQSGQPAINNTFQVDNKAKGPAPDVPGAKKGGTITVVGSADLDRSAPWADYRGDGILLSSQLITRTLTNYYEVIQPDGTIITKLMGDLATDTGKTTDCKTYTFTLRDGIKYSDGTTISSKDIAYGISLSFASEFADGPTYIQKWLAGTEDFNSVYKGPYKEAGKLAPNLETPDDKTIVFKFNSAHCDFPSAAALLTTVPLPQAKDPGAAKLETGFLASGPYKVGSYIRGEKLTLVRNDAWDPNSDPLRHNYPDSYIFDWKGTDVDLVSKRFIADGAADQASIMWDNVPSAEVQDAIAVPKSRQLDGDTVFNLYLYINNQRVTDVDVRRALLYSYNLDALKKIIGGDKAGTFPSTTITSPVTPGYKKFNAYPDNTLTGNVEKAKQLLQGKTLTPLKYCYRPGTPTREQTAAAAKQNLERSGFQIVLKPIDPTNFYPTVGKKDTDCDLIPAGWGQDFPSSSTVLGVLMKGGAAITPTGNNNLSYFDQPSVNAELDRLAAEPDLAKAAQGYGDLDQKIMTDYCPLVPLYYDHSFSLIGSKVGGAYLSGLWGAPSLQNIYFNG